MCSQSSLGGLARGVLTIFEVTKRVDEIFYSRYKAAHESSFESSDRQGVCLARCSETILAHVALMNAVNSFLIEGGVGWFM